MDAQSAPDVTSLALVLLAAFWSGTNSVFTGIKNTNEIRDQILKGKIGDDEITKEQRKRLFWWDWMPLKLSLSLISAVLCTVILVLPTFRGGYKAGPNFVLVCIVASIMPFIGAVFQLVSCVSDSLYLWRVIRTDPRLSQA